MNKFIVRIHIEKELNFELGFYRLEVYRILEGVLLMSDFALIRECIENTLSDLDFPESGYCDYIIRDINSENNKKKFKIVTCVKFEKILNHKI